ncbi:MULTISPECIES: hypothetical protein [Photorhabdus]|nr:hypothetical protein [Photorhabdus luminescens]
MSIGKGAPIRRANTAHTTRMTTRFPPKELMSRACQVGLLA